MVHREHHSIAGIFPKVLIRGDVGADKAVEREKQAEAEKEIARI
jgi:hypothetical protein